MMPRRRMEAKTWPKFCPHCGAKRLVVKRTRKIKSGIKRTRICQRCGKPVYTTLECFCGYSE